MEVTDGIEPKPCASFKSVFLHNQTQLTIASTRRALPHFASWLPRAPTPTSACTVVIMHDYPRHKPCNKRNHYCLILQFDCSNHRTADSPINNDQLKRLHRTKSKTAHRDPLDYRRPNNTAFYYKLHMKKS